MLLRPGSGLAWTLHKNCIASASLTGPTTAEDSHQTKWTCNFTKKTSKIAHASHLPLPLYIAVRRTCWPVGKFPHQCKPLNRPQWQLSKLLPPSSQPSDGNSKLSKQKAAITWISVAKLGACDVRLVFDLIMYLCRTYFITYFHRFWDVEYEFFWFSDCRCINFPIIMIVT